MSVTSWAAAVDASASPAMAAAESTVLPSEVAVANRWARRCVSCRGASLTCP